MALPSIETCVHVILWSVNSNSDNYGS